MGSTGGGSRGGRSKSGKYTGGGLTLFETRIESNMDIYDGIRHTIPYIDHHHRTRYLTTCTTPIRQTFTDRQIMC